MPATHRFRAAVWTFLALAVLSGPAAAQQQSTGADRFDELFSRPVYTDRVYQPVYSLEEMRRRRGRVFDHIGSNVAVLCGADWPEGWDRFFQYNNFYYLSGVEVPNAVLVLDGARRRSLLFLPVFSPHRVRFDGPALQPGPEAATRTGLDEVRPLDDLVGVLRSMIAGDGHRSSRDPANDRATDDLAKRRSSPRNIYTEQAPGERGGVSQDLFHIYLRPDREFPFDRRGHRLGDFVAGLRELFPDAAIKDLSEFLHEMRRVKSDEEMELMRESGRLAARALGEAIRATRPGIRERELEAICLYEFSRVGALPAWVPIVASGPNLHIFHYMANDRVLEPGDLLLIDVGPKYQYYCADITRTWPVSGTLTGRRRELFDACLAVHRTCVAAVRPGLSIQELTELYHAKAEELGIAEHIHRTVGHYTGMAPHDVGDPRRPFKPGVVFNVEPFIDIPEENIHIRFEDTVLVTEGGHEVLTRTSDAPWELEGLIELRDEPSRFED